MMTATALLIPSGSEQNANQTLSAQPANSNLKAKKEINKIENENNKSLHPSDEQKQTTGTFQAALTNTIQKKHPSEKTEKEKTAKKDNPLSGAVEQTLTTPRPLESALSALATPSKNAKNSNITLTNTLRSKDHLSSGPLKITPSRPDKSTPTVADAENNPENPIRQRPVKPHFGFVAPAATAAQPVPTTGQPVASNQPLTTTNATVASKSAHPTLLKKNDALANAATLEEPAPLKTQKIRPVSFENNIVQQSQIKTIAAPHSSDNSTSLELLENAAGTTKNKASGNTLKTQPARNLAKTKTADAEKTVLSTISSINSSAVAPARPHLSTIETQQNATAGLPINSSVKPAVSSPIDQIVSHLQMRSLPLEHQIRLVLSPAELGAIRMTFTQMDGQMAGLIEVQNEHTRAELQQLLGHLTAALESAGLTFARLEVSAWNNSNPSNLSSSQDEQSPQRHFDQTSDFLLPSDYQQTAENSVQSNTLLDDLERNNWSSSTGLNLYI